ncbi:murein biosynthesis integral membrane protein MurJ [Rhodococcus rhodnii]|uniref:Peptidoglycan lipid II flippase n=1 Tax=Rhodococcus rhodnii LMG 5362 TaxID=1273125 RepID=R7WKI5_9NOCA|nr:hypothetical protein Rrhod_2722 [Rhodococcus rhodnii LMG 5362]
MSTSSIAVATLASRITGFAKQVLLLTVLGVQIASPFTVAVQIPTMVSELLLGAVLTAIVVPVLVRAEREDADDGAAFVRRLFTAALLILGVGVVATTLAAPYLVRHVLLPPDGEVDVALATALAYLALPSILLYGVAALFTAILNTREDFAPGAWAPVANNLVVLAVLATYVLAPGEISLDPVRMGDTKLLILGVGSTLGAAAQLVTVALAVRRRRIDLRPLRGVDDRLRQFAGMACAIVVYVLIGQVGLIVTNHISAAHDVGGPAIYANAWALLQLPYGVLGVTILTAIMPRLSRHAASGDANDVIGDLSTTMRLTLMSLVPVAGFLTVAGPQIGEALFGYGNFRDDAERLGDAVRWSAFTLVPYSLVLVHLRVFYARGQAWMPTWIVLGITAVKIGCAVVVPLVAAAPDLVVPMLGAANGIGYAVGAIVGWVLLTRSMGAMTLDGVRRTMGVAVGATLAGASVNLLADAAIGRVALPDAFERWDAPLHVVADGLVFAVVTASLMYAAGLPELRMIRDVVRRSRPGSPEMRDTEAAPTAVLSLDEIRSLAALDRARWIASSETPLPRRHPP